MAMGTWRVDPQENRDLQNKYRQENNLSELTTPVNGGDSSSGQPGKYGSPEFYSYPEKRSVSDGEDSLLIQAVKYLAPSSGDPDFKLNMDIEKGQLGNIGDKGKIDAEFKMNTGMHTRYKRFTDADTGGAYKKKTRFYVELPIPQNISASSSTQFQEDDRNIFTLAALEMGQLAMQEGGDVGEGFTKAVSAINSNLDIGLQNGSISRIVKASMTSLALNQFGANINANTVLSKATGQILNSNKELLFSGVNLRSFQFRFNFAPRSSSEGGKVAKIIRMMKQSMAPKAGEDYQNSGSKNSKNSGIFLGAPDVFLLRYLQSGKDHPFLNSFKPCVLSQMNVNYTGSGTYATYSDGTPVHTVVDMTFKEINPIYDEDYDEENLKGVGY